MSWENNPNGSQNFGGQNPGGQQGGQWGQPGQQNPGGQPGGQWGAPQQGQQQGGQWGQPGQQNPGQPGQGGQWGAPQQGQQQGGQWGGQPNPGGQQGQGFGGQPGQGFGGQGYDANQQGYQPSQGFGGQGGYGAPPSGYAGQQRGPGKVILFVVIGVVVAALIGAGFMFFGKSKNDPNGIDVPPPTTPATEPATPEPTATSSPTSRPSSRPSSQPTTSQPSEPSGSGESVGLGISVDPASGWTVRTKKTGTVILSHSSGALFIVEVANGSGPAVDQARKWQDTAVKGGTNATKGDVTQKPQVHPSLDVAEAEITMNVSSGGGSQRLIVVAMLGVNDSKQTVSASQLAVPESAAGQASSLVSDANKMINSVLKSQV